VTAGDGEAATSQGAAGRSRRRPDRFTRPVGEAAAAQLSAYTYGTILTLAALLAVPTEAVSSGEAALVVAGTGISTFVAHVFSHALGLQLVVDRESGSMREHRVFRESVPILSATSLPLLLMLAGAAGWLGDALALRLAELFCIGRIAMTGFFISRFRGRPISVRTWLACVGLAAAGGCVVALKVFLSH
jgi:hypothetical protein